MLDHTLYFSKPLEALPKEEQYALAKQKMIALIFQGAGSMYASANNTASPFNRKIKHETCRRLWDGTIDEANYDYLGHRINKEILDQQKNITQVVTLQMPAKIRHIGIVRQRLQKLISEELDRPFVSRAYAIDEDTVDRKKQAHINSVLDATNKRVMSRIRASHQATMALAIREQAIQQSAQPQEGQPMDPGMQMQIQSITQEINYLKQVIAKKVSLDDTEIKKINAYYEYSFKDHVEMMCDQALKAYMETHRTRKLFNRGFTEQMILDEEVYYCNYRNGQVEPELRSVHGEFLWYQPNDNATYIHECDWIVEYSPMTIGQIRAKYGDLLTKDEMNTLVKQVPYLQHSDSWYSFNSSYTPDGSFAGRTHAKHSNETIDVYLCHWKEQVEIWAIVEDSKGDTSAPPQVIEIITEWEEKEKVDTEALKKKGQRLEVRVRNDLWRGIRIGRELYFGVQKCEYQYREPHDLADVHLPYIGYAVSYFNQPNSLMWETRELQDLYNVLHYQEEMLINLAGVRGIVYDMSQMPDYMEMEEVQYYMKNGILPIQTVRKDGKQSSFNQFTQYDMTLAPSIGTISQVKQMLINMVAMITGVNDQNLGQVTKDDAVGTTEMAIQQSSVVVEYYFQRHEHLLELVCTKMANMFVECYKEGKVGGFVVGKTSQQIVNIPKGELKGFFRVYCQSGSQQRMAIQAVRNIAQMKMQQNQLPASAYLELFDMTTIHDMRAMLKEYEDKFQAMAGQQQDQAKQAQMEIQNQKAQLDQQAALFNNKLQVQLEQIKSQLQGQQAQIAAQETAAKLAAQAQIAQSSEEGKRYAVDSERAIEEEFLKFNYAELEVNSTLDSTALKIDAMRDHVDLYSKMKGSNSNSPNKVKIKD